MAKREKFLLFTLLACVLALGGRRWIHSQKSQGLQALGESSMEESMKEEGEGEAKTHQEAKENTGSLEGQASQTSQGRKKQPSQASKPRTCTIYIDGQVKNPGLYELEEGERISQAIEAAGGLLETADLSRVNPAKKVEDEMRIFIPKEGEEQAVLVTGQTGTAPSSSQEIPKVDINHASLEELQTLPSIGEKKAEKIIAQRQKEPFQSIEEIKKVSGIGDKLFEQIQDYIFVSP